MKEDNKTTKKTTAAKKTTTAKAAGKKTTTAKKPAADKAIAKKPATAKKATAGKKQVNDNVSELMKLKFLHKVGMIEEDVLKKASNKALINIENLHVNFKRGGKLFEAVKGANLQINKGEILGLVGESGSGKTTLGRATISLWDHALGKVEIDGKELPHKRVKSVSKKNLWIYENGQMIFQDPTSSLNRQSKVMDIVSEGMDNFKTIEKEYKENLKKYVNELDALTKEQELLDTPQLKQIREAIAKVEIDVEKATEEVTKATDILKESKVELKYTTKLGVKKDIKAAEKLVKERTDDEAEAKEKLKVVKKELANVQKELDVAMAELSSDKEVIEKFSGLNLKKARREFIVNLISETEDEKILKMIEDHNRESEIREEIEKLWQKSKELKSNAHKRLAITKTRIASEKRALAEEAERDIKLFKDDMRHEIEEFKLLAERNSSGSDDEDIVERLKKRIQRFYLKATVSKSELPSDLKNKFPKDTEDIKKIKQLIKDLDAATRSKSKLDDTQAFYAKSLSITLQLILKKREKVVSPINTTAFDHNYVFINDIFIKRVHYFEKLIKDVKTRLELEQSKLDNVDEKETILIDFYTHSIEYLNEYKELLESYVKETESISIKFKEELMNHEDSVESIKKFYKWAIQQSKINDELKVSIVTWKGEKEIEYINRSIPKNDREIVIKLEELQHEGDLITKEYEHILNPSKELGALIKEDVDAFEKTYKVTAAQYKKELAKLPEIEKSIEELKTKITEANKVLKDKKVLKEVKIQRIKETLLKVGLNEDSLNKYPDQFSGGQKQRIGIARTIINKPKFVIADEPISALDVSVQAQVVNLLKDINEEMGLTMLFIAHDLQMVHYISDKIAVIYRGNIVEYGEADKVYHSPKHPYTKSLLGAMPSLTQVGKPLEVSDYSWDQHEYNEFSIINMHEVEEGHFVYGTEAEIKAWK